MLCSKPFRLGLKPTRSLCDPAYWTQSDTGSFTRGAPLKVTGGGSMINEAVPAL